MAIPKVMSGARAKVGVVDPTDNTVKYLGIMNQVSFGVVYGVADASILGRFTSASIDYTHAEIVQIQMSGWRVHGHGWHVDGRLPRVQDLLTAEYLELLVVDRAVEAEGTGEPRIAHITQVRCTSGQGGFGAKNLSEVSLTYVGILTEDESVSNAEHPTAMDLP